jgi:hypothetical protein
VTDAGPAVGIAFLPGARAPPVILCAIFAAGRATISWFPMDAPGAPATATGGGHRLLATAAFLSVALAAATLSRTLDHDPGDATPARVSGILSLVMLLALVAMVVDRRTGGRHFGIVERFFYLGMTAWLIALALLLASGGHGW